MKRACDTDKHCLSNWTGERTIVNGGKEGEDKDAKRCEHESWHATKDIHAVQVSQTFASTSFSRVGAVGE